MTAHVSISIPMIVEYISDLSKLQAYAAVCWERDLFTRDLLSLKSRPDQCIAVARDNHRFVGYCIAETYDCQPFQHRGKEEGKEMFIELLYVDDSYRRRGLASRMVDLVVRRATSLQVSVVSCSVLSGNFSTWLFWMSRGFEPSTRCPIPAEEEVARVTAVRDRHRALWAQIQEKGLPPKEEWTAWLREECVTAMDCFL